MDSIQRPLLGEVLIAYRGYWTALLQSAEPLWSQLDLTIQQLKGLILLEVRGEITVGGIATGLAIGRPSASVLVEQLVQLGLARRTEDSADRRRSLISLSDEGRNLAARLHRGDEASMEKRFACLGDEDLVALKQGLSALTGALLTTKI